MPGRRVILPSAMFTLVLIAALSAQATRTTHAADECLAKPTGPTPQGQHWYYRIDHANNNRQCWRLAMLVRRGMIDKAAAVDWLWEIAIAHALVRAFGEDRVQSIIGEAFADADFRPMHSEVA